MFEVGKKYKRKDHHISLQALTCMYVTDTSNLKSTGLAVAVLKWSGGAEESVDRRDWGNWYEYVEPKVATCERFVILNTDAGQIFTSPFSEYSLTNYKTIGVVRISYVEGQGLTAEVVG
jgi:hypothetical protein